MRQTIIGRYERESDGRLIIDVTVERLEELYDRFDSAASYIKKDLNEDFVDYLIECVKEIKQYDFLIRINLSRPESAEKFQRVQGSIGHYFKYLQESERREIRKHLSRSCYFLGFGVFLIFISLSLSGQYGTMSNILTDMSIEGVTIVAWVSMWEAVSNLTFEWIPHLQRLKLYERIIASEVRFCPADRSC
ncbi:MAG: hypothetical protein OEV91_00525 [Desulfobulbaceae bacterium]|nr:hypothetical protein [Desulfobulbaceae bacterium]